jgi:hypothetical protein
MAKRLQEGPFRRPEDMNIKLGSPRTVRFTHNTETQLMREAAKAGIGFSTLVSQICDDYVKWLEDERSARTK